MLWRGGLWERGFSSQSVQAQAKHRRELKVRANTRGGGMRKGSKERGLDVEGLRGTVLGIRNVFDVGGAAPRPPGFRSLVENRRNARHDHLCWLHGMELSQAAVKKKRNSQFR